ncbi:MAG: hypothetical protein ABSC23_00170 [Bryobacteraceae bacterium]|jgi:hypothetical protein
MAKCFFTGIEVDLENAYLLDRGAAKRALRSLKLRVAAVERLISQLNPKDNVEVFDRKSGGAKVRPQRRLVCRTVADALSASYPESPLFLAWREFTARRPPVFSEFQRSSGAAAESGGHQARQEPATAAGAQDRAGEDAHAGPE